MTGRSSDALTHPARRVASTPAGSEKGSGSRFGQVARSLRDPRPSRSRQCVRDRSHRRHGALRDRQAPECRSVPATAIPFANQDGAGFDPSQSRPWPALPTRLSAGGRAPSAEALERPADGVGEIAESIRLQAIGENARQKRLRQMDGSGSAKDVSPLQAKAGQIERGETCDRLSERLLLDWSQRWRGWTLAGAAR